MEQSCLVDRLIGGRLVAVPSHYTKMAIVSEEDRMGTLWQSLLLYTKDFWAEFTNRQMLLLGCRLGQSPQLVEELDLYAENPELETFDMIGRYITKELRGVEYVCPLWARKVEDKTVYVDLEMGPVGFAWWMPPVWETSCIKILW